MASSHTPTNLLLLLSNTVQVTGQNAGRHNRQRVRVIEQEADKAHAGDRRKRRCETHHGRRAGRVWRLTIAKCIAETRCLLCHCSSVLSVLPSQSVCARGERICMLVSAVALAGMTLRRNLTLVTVALRRGCRRRAALRGASVVVTACISCYAVVRAAWCDESHLRDTGQLGGGPRATILPRTLTCLNSSNIRPCVRGRACPAAGRPAAPALGTVSKCMCACVVVRCRSHGRWACRARRTVQTPEVTATGSRSQ